MADLYLLLSGGQRNVGIQGKCIQQGNGKIEHVVDLLP